MIRAAFVTVITFAYILIVGGPSFLFALVSGNTDPVYRVGQWGAAMAVWLSGATVKAAGFEKIPQNQAVVFMPNHQSNFDPPALVCRLPPVLVLVKKEFFRVPLLGWAIRLRGFISVDRKNRPSAIAAVERAARSLQSGKSFLAFPEGTRSADGRLQPFKKGVFIMALKAGAPIVPISISGSHRVMPKGKWIIRRGTVRITVHEPIPTAGCGLDDMDRLIEKVRAAILSGLDEDEQPVLP